MKIRSTEGMLRKMLDKMRGKCGGDRKRIPGNGDTYNTRMK
jgi:hypothetical protein